MNRFYIVIGLILFSCSSNSEERTNSLVEENTKLKQEIAALKNQVKELSDAKTTIIENQHKGNPDPDHSKIISIKDQKKQEDTLDLKENGNEFVYKRTVEITEIENDKLATILGLIRENLSAPGISVFTICDGGSLPLEMCNCTDNIYVSLEPDNLGEDFTLFKISNYYDVKLLGIERIKDGYETKDYHLIFEHGKYPRKKEKISLFDLKFVKTTGNIS